MIAEEKGEVILLGQFFLLFQRGNDAASVFVFVVVVLFSVSLIESIDEC